MEWSESSCKWRGLLAWCGWDQRRKESFSWAERRGIQRRSRQKSSSEPGRPSMKSKFKAPSTEDLQHHPLWSQRASTKDRNLESNRRSLLLGLPLERREEMPNVTSLHWKSGLKSSSTSRRSPSCLKKKPGYPLRLLFCQEYEQFSYLLVLKDDLSHFVDLIPSERTDHVVVVHALVDWFKGFGVAETHVSDKGSHFKNKVVAELNDVLKTKHHFTTAYSPKSNGTVGRVNREIMKVLRSQS